MLPLRIPLGLLLVLLLLVPLLLVPLLLVQLLLVPLLLVLLLLVLLLLVLLLLFLWQSRFCDLRARHLPRQRDNLQVVQRL